MEAKASGRYGEQDSHFADAVGSQMGVEEITDHSERLRV